MGFFSSDTESAPSEVSQNDDSGRDKQELEGSNTLSRLDSRLEQDGSSHSDNTENAKQSPPDDQEQEDSDIADEQSYSLVSSDDSDHSCWDDSEPFLYDSEQEEHDDHHHNHPSDSCNRGHVT